MYLSKISFDARRGREIVSTLNEGLYFEHQLIWSFLPKDEAAQRDFLYRRDDSQAVPFFYLLSQRKPMVENDLFHCQTRVFAPQLHSGDCLNFSLRANAVKSHKAQDTNRRVRSDIVKAKTLDYEQHSPDAMPSLAQIRYDAGCEWLTAQGEKKGFKVLSMTVENHVLHHFSASDKAKDDQKQFFASMDYQGVLQVTDPTVFMQEALVSGLGRSKAFGCGLLLIRRV